MQHPITGQAAYLAALIQPNDYHNHNVKPEDVKTSVYLQAVHLSYCNPLSESSAMCIGKVYVWLKLRRRKGNRTVTRFLYRVYNVELIRDRRVAGVLQKNLPANCLQVGILRDWIGSGPN